MSLICAVLVWFYTLPLDGSEFSGGRITGPILKFANLGVVFFGGAAILTLVRGFLGGLAGLIACLLTFPIYLYVVFPGPFRTLFRGDYSVPLRSSVAWDFNSALGMLALTLAAVGSLNLLLTRSAPEQDPP